MAEQNGRISIRWPSARRNFNKPIRIMDWHARACVRALYLYGRPRRKCNVLSESRFVSFSRPRVNEGGWKRKRKRARGPPRNSKWTAVSDVGATELRKYFSRHSLHVLFIGSGKLFLSRARKFEMPVKRHESKRNEEEKMRERERDRNHQGVR